MSIDRVALGASVLLLIAFGAVRWALATVRTNQRAALARRLKLRPESDAPAGDNAGLAQLIGDSLRPLARLATPTDETEVSRIRLRLARAGIRRDHAVSAFLASKIVLAVAALLAFLWFNAARATPVPNALLVAVVVCAVGFYAPNLWVSSRISERQLALQRALPDSLDLLVTCVEAGLALDAALLRVANEVRLASPILAEELELTFLEVKAGMQRAQAFRRLADRTGVEDLKQLAATLTQTEMFGTSVGAALRVQADGMRVRRMQRAEERAAMVAVKMTLPLVLCILPSLFAVILGPAIVNIIETLMPQLGK